MKIRLINIVKEISIIVIGYLFFVVISIINNIIYEKYKKLNVNNRNI